MVSNMILNCVSGEMVSNAVASELFEKMDLNEDGFVTEEEFVSVCLSNESISKLLVDNINDLINSDESDSDSD